MAKIIKIVRGYKPICYLHGGLLLSRGFEIYFADANLENIRYINTLPISRLKKLIGFARLTARLFRLELGPALLLQNDKVLIFAKRECFSLDLKTSEVKHEYTLTRGSRPLKLTNVNLPGFKPGAYFGEYVNNPAFKKVKILCRSADGIWEVAYVFPDGEINHIHGIYQDDLSQSLFILTGDFKQGAAIWRAIGGFSNIERCRSGSQQVRSCWIERINGKLVYASDTQSEYNHLYTLIEDGPGNATLMEKKLFPLNGSSIYHVEDTRNGIVFATTVEPQSETTSLFFSLFKQNRAEGILGDVACIYSGDIGHGFTLLTTAKKDWLSARLFQFGSFQFPAGVGDDPNIVHAYGVAVVEFDNCILVINKQEEINS